MLIRFWSLTKKALHSPVLNRQCQTGWNAEIKLKIQACFTLYFKFSEGTSVKMQLPVLFFLILNQLLYQQISFFYNFLELHSTLSEKQFCHKSFFFNGFTQTSHPLNSQNLLSVTQRFWSVFPKCLLNFF